jgi:hypothetical protein
VWIDLEAPDPAKVESIRLRLERKMTYAEIAEEEGLERCYMRFICKRLGLVESGKQPVFPKGYPAYRKTPARAAAD